MGLSKDVVIVRDISLGRDCLDFSPDEIFRVQKLLKEGLGKIDNFLETLHERHVFIKPNFVRPDPVNNPSLSTDGRVVLALVDLLREYGPSKISIGDNPGYGLDFSLAIADAKLVNELVKRNVQLVNIDKLPRKRIINDKAILFREYDKPSIEYDIFINLAKMKTHMHTQVSLAVKNLYGLVVDDQRLTFHREDLHRKLIEILYVQRPSLNIIDALLPMEGQAPLYGNPVYGFNSIIMSRNILGADIVSSSLMGFEPYEINMFRIAKGLGFGSIDIKDYKILGIDPEKLRKRFKRPVLSSAGAYDNILSIECGVCSGCLSGIRHSLDKLSFEGILSSIKGELAIFSGKSVQNKEILKDYSGRIILYGNCALDIQFYDIKRRENLIFVPGCAPHIFDLHKKIKKEVLWDVT